MTRQQIILKIQELLREVVDEDELEIDETTTADDVADWDSTNHVRLIVAVEQELGIRFEASEIASPENVGEFADLIASKLQKK